MAKDAYWFRHDANARNDIKIIELRSLHGYEGYGIYFAILEVMREQTHYSIPEAKIGMVGVALGESPQKVSAIINDCVSIGLFAREGELIYSPSFVARMSKWEDVKTRNETNGSKGGRPKSNPKHNPNETQSKPRRGEENREEEKREEKNKEAVRFAPPSVDEVFGVMGDRKQAEMFVNFYDSKGWKVGTTKMQNWRSAVKGWMSRNNTTPEPMSTREQFSNYGDSI